MEINIAVALIYLETQLYNFWAYTPKMFHPTKRTLAQICTYS